MFTSIYRLSVEITAKKLEKSKMKVLKTKKGGEDW